MCWPEFLITKHAGFAYKNADQRHETLTEGKTGYLEEVFAIAVFTWLCLTFFSVHKNYTHNQTHYYQCLARAQGLAS